MRKQVMTMGLTAIMGIMSVVPAFAATTDLTANDGDGKTAFEALQDNADSAESADYWKALDGTFADQDDARATEVGVQQSMSYTVTIPSFISLNGVKGADNKATFKVGVAGDIAGSSTITVKPDLTSTTEGVTNGTTYTAFDAASGTGTFALKEDGGVKKDLVATIKLKDTDWKINDKDTGDIAGGTTTAGTADVIGADADTASIHMGEVSVASLKAGTWRNTINFDITYAN